MFTDFSFIDQLASYVLHKRYAIDVSFQLLYIHTWMLVNKHNFETSLYKYILSLNFINTFYFIYPYAMIITIICDQKKYTLWMHKYIWRDSRMPGLRTTQNSWLVCGLTTLHYKYICVCDLAWINRSYVHISILGLEVSYLGAYA